MISSKKLLCALLFFCTNTVVLSKPSEPPTLYEWIKSFFTTPADKSKFVKATEESVPLDLLAFYKEKEGKEASSFNNAENAAKKFKESLVKAANNDPIMKKFKDKPEQFLFGGSSSDHQYNGDPDDLDTNANVIFYKEKGFKTAGKAIDFWNKYKNDIPQMQDELGINSFRISIGWDRVQPGIKGWDRKAIDHYVDMIRTLKQHGIEPIVVLHHYTIPQWFAKIGGFEHLKNGKYFVTFAEEMYAALYKDVTYWSTFNAIEGYAFKGYFTLDGPPGKEKSYTLTQQVMANMLEAHVQTYKALKNRYQELAKLDPKIPNPQIGIQKNIVLLDPYPESYLPTRKLTQLLMSIGGTPLQNKGFFGFFTTGTFYVPGLITYTNPDAKKALDWIGLNIYSNRFMVATAHQQEQAEERTTNNLNYRDYPEGIYRAVKIIYDNIAKPLNIPIIITENGIATENDTKGNEKRTRFFKRALYTIRKLIEEGYPIIGYTPWACHDNYEWPSKEQPNPYDRPYGFFHVDFQDPNLKRTLKTGSYFYRDFVKAYLGKK